MNVVDGSRLQRALLDRCSAIAGEWHTAIAGTSFVPYTAMEIRQRLAELTEQAVALLFTESFDRDRARAIGAALIHIHYVHPEALGRTQEVLARHLVEGLSADQAVALQPRLFALLGELAIGFLQGVCERILTEQEQTREALVSELRRIEEARRKSEETARALLNAPSDPAFLIYPDGTIVALNEAGARSSDRSPDELVGACAFDFFPPEVTERRKAWIERVVCSGEPVHFEDQRAGRWFDNRIYPVFDAQGKVRQLAVYVRDITEWKQAQEELIRYRCHLEELVDKRTAELLETNERLQREIAERKQVEEALRESETRYRTTIDAMDDFVHVVDRDLRWMLFNEAARRAVAELGGQDDLVGKGLFEVFPFLPQRVRQEYEYVLETGKSLITEEETEIRGQMFWTETRKIPILDDEGKTNWVVTIIRDITERKLAEESLRRWAVNLDALQAAVLDITTRTDLPVLLQTVAEQAARLLDAPGSRVCLCGSDSEGAPCVVSHGALRDCGEMVFWHSNGLVSKVALTGKPLIVEDSRLWNGRGDLSLSHFEGMQFEGERPALTLLASPMIRQCWVTGVVCVADSAENRHFTQTDLQLLTLFADHAATAIENVQLLEQVRAGRERLQALSRRLVDVQEAERRHIARELHDEIGQALTGLNLLLGASARTAGDAAEPRLKEAQALVRELMERIDELSLDLRPAMLDDLGLLPALLWHFKRYTTQTGVRVSLEHSGLEGRFATEVETAAYRLVQEALTNVARHAGVQEVVVRLWADQDTLSLQVEDRGSGFVLQDALASGDTAGLSGMYDRVALLGGQLTVESRPGAGTRLTAELPLDGTY